MDKLRLELDTAIEKEVHKYVQLISEHVHDFVHLYVRRNNIPIDPTQMKEVLKIVKLAISDGEFSKINMFHEGIKDKLDNFTVVDENHSPFSEETPQKRSPYMQHPQQEQRPTGIRLNLGDPL